MSGAITAQDREFVEQWENIAVPAHDIIRFDIRGDTKHELIQGRRIFTLTTAERLITQERILKKEDDPFQNGAFRPVVVPDTVSIESNPNALSDEEIQSILKSSAIAWTEWMKVIDSPATLSRMLDISDEVEDFPLKRYKELGAKLSDVRPKTQIKQKDRDQFESLRTSGVAPA